MIVEFIRILILCNLQLHLLLDYVFCT